jgi:hypothetical protein
VHYNLKRLSPPNIVWALAPAVATSLKDYALPLLGRCSGMFEDEEDVEDDEGWDEEGDDW